MQLDESVFYLNNALVLFLRGWKESLANYLEICPRIFLASAAGSAAAVMGRPTTM